MKTAALAIIFLLASPMPASAIEKDPRLDCAVYKAKIKQWKQEELRGDLRAEGLALQAVAVASMQVLSHLGYSRDQLEAMKGWDVGGDLSKAYFTKDGKYIKREISPYQMALKQGLLGKEAQAVSFCSGLGINVSAYSR